MVKPWRRRAAKLGCLLILAVSSAGCAAAAATQLIPLAFQGAEVAGITIGSAVSGKEPTEDTEDTAERCDALAATPPYMGELIQTETGSAVRGLILGDQNGTPKWFLSTTVTSLAQLQFSSPINRTSDEGSKKKRNFLAYAPSQPQDERENNQLIAFLGTFESGPGVLSINGRNYRYAWVEKLPCFKPAI
ncbi:MAG: hypothetical protein ACLQU2_30405 [Candidatus Binataceae bacterium]